MASKKKAKRKLAKKRTRKPAARKRNAHVGKKYKGDNRKIRKAKRAGHASKLASYKNRSHARAIKAMANPQPKKAKTNRWYKGPRGVKVRVRRVRGKFVVDVK